MKTNLFGIIGYPLKFTLSPIIHNTAFRLTKYNGRYIVLKTKKNSVRQAVKLALHRKLIGFNVTAPYKETIIPYLDRLDKTAKKIGAVNAVKTFKNKLIGYNTDGIGFLSALKFHNFKLQNKNVVIFGAGGTAKAISFSLCQNKIKSLTIANRTVKKSKDLVRKLRKMFPKIKISYSQITNYKKFLPKTDLFINCTLLGATGEPEFNFPLNNLNKKALIFDVNYKKNKTKLTKFAKKNDYQYITGHSLLFFQAMESLKIWLGN